MQQIIDIPGVGEVEFPDTMSDEEVSAAAKRLHDEANAGKVSPLGEKLSDARSGMANAVIGAGKGALRTAVGLGRLVHKIPGVSEGVDKLYSALGVEGVNSGRDFGERDLTSLVAGPQASAESRLGLDAQNTGEKVGMALEQGAEYMIPAGATRRAAAAIVPRVAGRLIPAMTADAASSAAVATAHGDDPKTAAAMGALIPAGGAMASRAGKLAKDGAVRFVRAAIKPTVTEMKQTAGASRVGIDRMADRVSKFILDNRITTPDKAQAIIDEAETAIQMLVGGQATDAPARAARYLQALRRSAARQGLGADDIAAIQKAAGELVDGPMGETVTRQVTTMQPSRILNAQGQPAGQIPVTTNVSSRQLRASVPADEALSSARASSRWSTRRTWGEQKGASTEASKAVERAQRDAVKAAVPESRPIFEGYSQAIKARDILRRSDFRQANRDVVGLPTHVIAAGEMARGKVPIMAVAANWLRNNQLKAGIWSDRLGNAIKNNDVQTVTEIMSRLGVSLGADAAGKP